MVTPPTALIPTIDFPPLLRQFYIENPSPVAYSIQDEKSICFHPCSIDEFTQLIVVSLHIRRQGH